MNMIDLVAILPFYIDGLLWLSGVNSGGAALNILRLLRLIRVFRIFKLSRYNANLTLCATAMFDSRDTLGLMIFMVIICVVLFSCIIFFFEHGTEQDDVCCFTTDVIKGDTSRTKFV